MGWKVLLGGAGSERSRGGGRGRPFGACCSCVCRDVNCLENCLETYLEKREGSSCVYKVPFEDELEHRNSMGLEAWMAKKEKNWCSFLELALLLGGNSDGGLDG